MKLPAYPLITVDPFFSIWSKSDKLYDSDTALWCGLKKRMKGTIQIDGKNYRFMGLGDEYIIPQTALEITPYITVYTFENADFTLKVKFWTPLLFDNLYDLSLPCSFIEYKIQFGDDKKHQVSVSLSMHEEFFYNIRKTTAKEIVSLPCGKAAKMGRTTQKPIYKSGDAVAADWGYFYIFGGNPCINKNSISAVQHAEIKGKSSLFHIVAFDDIYSIEYMGVKYKGLWTEKHKSIEAAIQYCLKNKKDLYGRIKKQNKMVLNDAEEFGKDYCSILTTAARQVLAAHKLFRSCKGDLLYFSKECNSNGCINTVDVTYPAIPMFLLYRPELVRAMLTGIFEFAGTAAWKNRFAPHDIGQYPIANGQVYGLNRLYYHRKKELYKIKKNVLNPACHMPIEECGNMLITAYAYYRITNDSTQLKEYYRLLKKWADYLTDCGVVLENQLCTDDFAGHSEKNVNLAIKSIMGIACFSKISEALGIKTDCFEIAKHNAEKLISLSETKGGYLSFSIGNENSWSLKYNLVWDILFGFDLFGNELYKNEISQYKKMMNPYGTPLDYRKDFTKTDWMLWASCLDSTTETTKSFSECIVKYLEATNDKNCFTDWYDTVKASECGFNHRSVQAGLWMPVLKNRLMK
ncbi:MAG: DUF4965 domain-containing protein [Eubacterium sp.]